MVTVSSVKSRMSEATVSETDGASVGVRLSAGGASIGARLSAGGAVGESIDDCVRVGTGVSVAVGGPGSVASGGAVHDTATSSPINTATIPLVNLFRTQNFRTQNFRSDIILAAPPG
jgi:hypothetical protein